MASGPTVSLCIFILTISGPTSGFVLPKGSLPATGTRDPAGSSIGFDLMDWYTLMAVNMLTKAKQQPSFNVPVVTTPVNQPSLGGVPGSAQKIPTKPTEQAEEPSRPAGQPEEPVRPAGQPEEPAQPSNQTEEAIQANGMPEEPVAPGNQIEEPVQAAGLPEEPLQQNNQTEEPATVNQSEEPAQPAGLPEEPIQTSNQTEEPAQAAGNPEWPVSQVNKGPAPYASLTETSPPLDQIPITNQTEQIVAPVNQTQDTILQPAVPFVPTPNISQTGVSGSMYVEPSVSSTNQSVEQVAPVSPATQPFLLTNVSEIAAQGNTTLDALTVPSNLKDAVVPIAPAPSQSDSIMQQRSVPQGMTGQQSLPQNVAGQLSVPQKVAGQLSVPPDVTDQQSAPQDIVGQRSVPQYVADQQSVPQDLAGQQPVPQDVAGQQPVTQGVAGQQSASVGSLNPLDQPMKAKLMSSQTGTQSPVQQPIYIPYWMKPVIIALGQPRNNIEKILQALKQI